jgi:hypothetical protein
MAKNAGSNPVGPEEEPIPPLLELGDGQPVLGHPSIRGSVLGRVCRLFGHRRPPPAAIESRLLALSEAFNAGSDTAGFLNEVTLAYRRITWEYRPTGMSGTPVAPAVTGGWDLRTNQNI